MKLPEYRPGRVQSLGREDVNQAGSVAAAFAQGISDITDTLDELDEEQAKIDVMRAEAAYETEKAQRENERKSAYDYDPAELKDRYGIVAQADPRTGRVPAHVVEERLEKYDAEELSKKHGGNFTGRRKDLWEKVTINSKVASFKRASERALRKRQDFQVASSAEAKNQIVENVTAATEKAALQMAIAHRDTQVRNGVSADKARADFEQDVQAINQNLRGNELEGVEDDFDNGLLTPRDARAKLKQIEQRITDPDANMTNSQRLALRNQADAVRQHIREEERRDRAVRARGTGFDVATKAANRHPDDLEAQLADARKHRQGDNSPTAILEREAAITAVLNRQRNEAAARAAQEKRVTDESWERVKQSMAMGGTNPAMAIDPDVPHEDQQKMHKFIRQGGPPPVNNQNVDRVLASRVTDRNWWRGRDLDQYIADLTPERMEHYKKIQRAILSYDEPGLTGLRTTLDRYYRNFGMTVGAAAGDDDQLRANYLDNVVLSALATYQDEKIRQGQNPKLTPMETNQVVLDVMKAEARKGRQLTDPEIEPDEVYGIWNKARENNADIPTIDQALWAMRRRGMPPSVANLVKTLRKYGVQVDELESEQKKDQPPPKKQGRGARGGRGRSQSG